MIALDSPLLAAECCDLAMERQMCSHRDPRCQDCCDRLHVTGAPYRCARCPEEAVEGGLCVVANERGRCA